MRIQAKTTRADTSASATRQVVVVHRGARDGYQVSAALAQAGLLKALVTDLYLGSRRSNPDLPPSLVRQTRFSGLVSFAIEKIRALPFDLRQSATRWCDASLGKRAGRLAAHSDSTLLSYSYYGFEAFRNYSRPGMLFQLHPHPMSVRRLLGEERLKNPDCAASLDQEWELSLPALDFERLVKEVKMASYWLAASSFTRSTLIENGVPAGAIDVIPYGVDLQRFTPGTPRGKRGVAGPLRLLFVGRINQRKGLKYLLQAIRLLRSQNIQLTICGRVLDDLSILKGFEDVITVRPSVTGSELLEAYRQADLFVLPSLVEGFGQVILESLACGLPVLTTTHTAGPDLIDHGIHGFVVKPSRSEALADRLQWALDHRAELNDMRQAARLRAERFTWQRFRESVVDSVLRFQYTQVSPKEIAPYV